MVDVYRATDCLPREEKFGSTSQLRRAAASVPANIAEGAARKSGKEFLHFLSHAQGSASEVETELLIASRLGFLGEKEYVKPRASLDEIGRMLMGLSRHVSRRLE